MLFMVIERFGHGLDVVGERFQVAGRRLPEGVTYLASWMERAGTCCFQLMEAPDRRLLDVWMERWSDLVSFEVFPVISSAEFWATR
jgi:hypothetical protein